MPEYRSEREEEEGLKRLPRPGVSTSEERPRFVKHVRDNSVICPIPLRLESSEEERRSQERMEGDKPVS